MLQVLQVLRAPDPLVQEAKQRARVEGEVEVLLFQNARCVPETQAPR
jgi:hypothetical protein